MGLAAILLSASACTFPNRRDDLRIWQDVANHGLEFERAFEQTTGIPFEGGNTVELVENGQIFDELERDIGTARQSINIAPFIWRPSPPSDRIVKAVLERTRAGVACRVLVDPFWSAKFREVHDVLHRGGCDVREFRPLWANLGPTIFLRNHRRAIVIDDRIAYTGGFGIWRSWEGRGLVPEHWRDTNARVTGPVVRQIQLAFAESWQEVGGKLLPGDELAPVAPTGHVRAAFVPSAPTPATSKVERMTILMVATAKERLWISNAYFIPSTALCDMLIAKAKAGVDVRVLAPGPVTDVPPIRAAQRSTYERLLAGGVRIFEYAPSMMHAKTMLVDDQLAVVGSANIDPLSNKWMEEGELVVEDPGVNAELARSLERDFTHSLEIRLSWWSKRGWIDRLWASWVPLIGLFL